MKITEGHVGAGCIVVAVVSSIIMIWLTKSGILYIPLRVAVAPVAAVVGCLLYAMFLLIVDRS